MTLIKLDENLSGACATLLRGEGFDVHTVLEENLAGHRDERILAACVEEGRTLITLDLDFANPIRFDPSLHCGVIVLRPEGRSSRSQILSLLRPLCGPLRTEVLRGQLWIIELGRIRVYKGMA